MNAQNYIAAQAAYHNLVDAVEVRAGSGPLKAEDEAALRAAVLVEDQALTSMSSTPAQSLGELAERAAILAGLIEAELWEEHCAALATRIASDLARLAAGNVTPMPLKRVGNGV